MRRTIDIILAAAALIFLSPVMLLLAISTYLLIGKTFVVVQGRLKFWVAYSWIRRFSIDDLPVLIQVLVGEHSLFEPEIYRLFWPASQEKP